VSSAWIAGLEFGVVVAIVLGIAACQLHDVRRGSHEDPPCRARRPPQGKAPRD